MRIKRKIPSFIFGLSIGLILGIGFFIFKIDDILKRVNKPKIDNIKITEKVFEDTKTSEFTSPEKQKVKLKKSTNLNYKEVDSLIKEEDVNIAKEELLTVKTIKVIDLDSKTESKDTLTGHLAGVKAQDYPDVFFVEFWRTPLNSKGYRMTRNRVVLYGISDFSSLTLYKVDDNFYIKNDEIVYKISSGTEFKPMEIVRDNDLLAKIN
jgi:hypothetical protein